MFGKGDCGPGSDDYGKDWRRERGWGRGMGGPGMFWRALFGMGGGFFGMGGGPFGIGGGMMGMGGLFAMGGGKFMRKLLGELDLSEEQMEKLAELRQNSFAKMAHGQIDKMDSMQKLMRELGGENINKEKIQAIKQKIKEQKSAMADLMVDNMLEFAEILTPEQRKQLRKKKMRLFFDMNSFGPERGPCGHEQEHRPEHGSCGHEHQHEPGHGSCGHKHPHEPGHGSCGHKHPHEPGHGSCAHEHPHGPEQGGRGYPSGQNRYGYGRPPGGFKPGPGPREWGPAPDDDELEEFDG